MRLHLLIFDSPLNLEVEWPIEMCKKRKAGPSLTLPEGALVNSDQPLTPPSPQWGEGKGEGKGDEGDDRLPAPA